MTHTLTKTWACLAAATLFLGLSGTATPAFSASSADTDAAVTYSKHVAPILRENCESCHRAGQIAPMPLTSFEEARPWAKSIVRQVVGRKMPPWFAAPDSRPMKGDLNLTPEEIDTVVRWVDLGAPEGDPADLPAARTYESFAGGWRLKEPDVVLQVAEPFAVGKEVDDEYRCFAIPYAIEHDLWLKSVEYQAGNSEVVHHFILFGDSNGVAEKLDDATAEPGWECGSMEASIVSMKILSMWAPGNVSPLSPRGTGRKIPANSQLMLQIHYHNTTGADQLDQSKVALHLAQPDETIDKELRSQLVSAWTLDIKAGDSNSEHQATYTTPEDITVYATGVHMHYRGKDMGLWATQPDQERETLIWVPHYDFNWQLTYEFAEPLRAPAGSVFQMISHHDNSENNPFNPVIPPIDVKWGLATSDEMSFSGIVYSIDSEKLGITPRLPGPTVPPESTGAAD